MALLAELLEHVEGGRGQVVGIVAEAEGGKSRLLYEFGQCLVGKRVTYLAGRCLSYGQDLPYHPIIDLLRTHCGITEADSPVVIAGKVRMSLQEVGMGAEASAPYLLQLLDVGEGTEHLVGFTPEAIKARTFETLREMSLHSSQQRPLICEIEDLHWCDNTSEDYLAWLAESVAGAPILLLVTYRPGYRPPWLDKSYVTQIALRNLTPQDSMAVVRSTRQHRELPAHLEQMIIEKAEGNPFFLEELTRAVLDHADITTDVAVPETIQGVLMARVDRLPEASKRLLQIAAVLGREVSPPLLEAMWDGSGPLEPLLLTLMRQEFLFMRPGVICFSRGAWTLWWLGYPDRGLVRNEEALVLAQQSAHPFSLGFALTSAAVFQQCRRDGSATRERAEPAVMLAPEQGFPFWRAFGLILHGWALAHQGQAHEGLDQIRQGLTDWRATGAEQLRSYFLGLLAEAYGVIGAPASGLVALTEALTLVGKTGERWYEPELHRLEDELLLQQSADHHPEAQASFQKALDVAHSLEAKSWELRAATSLARLWRQQGRREEAYRLLAEVYGWFTEGFDTADLQDAKALLGDLPNAHFAVVHSEICHAKGSVLPLGSQQTHGRGGMISQPLAFQRGKQATQGAPILCAMARALGVIGDDRLKQGLRSLLERGLPEVKAELFEISCRSGLSPVTETAAHYR